MFSEILKLLPAGIVDRAVRAHGADRWRKSFRTRDHLLAMLAAQFSSAGSLRQVETLIGAYAKRTYHLGGLRVRRSTLAQANATRTPAVFATIAADLIAHAGRAGRPAKDLMAALDSTSIRLAGRGHGWAEACRTRNGNQGLKLHLRIAAESAAAEWLKVTDMTVNDITAAREMPLEKGRIYLFDKGYCDYNWWMEIIETGADFITRLKRNAAFEIIGERDCDGETILSDQVIRLANKAPRGGKKNRLAARPLRLVRIPHPGGKKRPFLIVSSLLDASAEDIAEGYRRRWSIELIFKWIKQNLKIKRFLGESRNAVAIQIYTAIIAYILVRMYHRLFSNSKHRLLDVMTLLAANLFHPRPNPTPPKPPPDSSQPSLWEAAA